MNWSTSTYKLCFHYAVLSVTQQDFRRKIKAPFTVQSKCVSHCATKSGRGFVFSGSYPQVMVEQLEYLWKLPCKRKKNPADKGE